MRLIYDFQDPTSVPISFRVGTQILKAQAAYVDLRIRARVPELQSVDLSLSLETDLPAIPERELSGCKSASWHHDCHGVPANRP